MGTSDLSIPLYNSMLLMVGSGDEIDMKRTEMDVYDYLYNEISCVPMHRITAGSTKEGLRLSASDVDVFYYLTNHHGVWDFTDAKCTTQLPKRLFSWNTKNTFLERFLCV